MLPLAIVAIVALIAAGILAVVIWTIVFIEYKKIKKQERIDQLYKRILERAEDSGNESEGDTEELSTLMEMGNLDFRNANDQ
uniref:Protein Vpu n=1 Tax=Human immunodeficiency virus type 1 TaxID=11676 RepID=A0A0M4APC7_HV1|nr:vpu protein [Human immunodeficiency virus 1]